jgi:cell division protein ZapA
MQELTPINIVIGDRTYRIKIDLKNEEVVRKTVKLVNEKIIEFKTGFAGKDMQDYIAMVLIWFATIEKGGETDLLGEKALTERLQSLENNLDKVLEG